jgi:hypothetical protein
MFGFYFCFFKDNPCDWHMYGECPYIATAPGKYCVSAICTSPPPKKNDCREEEEKFRSAFNIVAVVVVILAGLFVVLSGLYLHALP